MKKHISAFLFLLSLIQAFAQGEGNHWYFGYNAGLDFSSGAPVADLNGAMNTWEGRSAVSNKTGQLLFYTLSLNGELGIVRILQILLSLSILFQSQILAF